MDDDLYIEGESEEIPDGDDAEANPDEVVYIEDNFSRMILDDDGPRVKLMRSSVGTGKTVTAIFGAAEFCLRVVPMTAKGKPGKARVLVVRQDQTKLKSTILASFRMWFSAVTDDLTSMLYPIVIKDVPFVGEVDGVERTVLIEWVFMGVATKEDASKLRSFEATCAIINEIQYYDGPWIVDEVDDRLGRYPLATRDKFGAKTANSYMGQKMIYSDFNPPDDLHWLYKLEMGKRPDAWKFYAYPPPVLPIVDAEGTIIDVEPNPAADYAEKQPSGYDYWINKARDLLQRPGTGGKLKVDVFGEYGTNQEGKPVYPEWADEYHIAKTTMVAVAGRKIPIGFDHSGIHPAMVYGQVVVNGMVALHELYIGECIVEDFIEDVFIPFNNVKGYDKKDLIIILDPADALDRTGNTTRKMLMKRGFRTVYAPSNDPIKRQAAVKKLLVTRQLLVAKECAWLIGGFRGRYNREKIKNTEHYKMLPDAEKNEFSHVQDGMQYLALWAAAGMSLAEEQYKNQQQTGGPARQSRGDFVHGALV